MIDHGRPTEKQLDDVRGIQRRLHLPDRLLDDHCVGRFKQPLRDLDRRQRSDLLDEMIGWAAVPADAGGDAEQFRRVSEAYQQGMEAVSQ